MDLIWCNFFTVAYQKGIYEFSKDFLLPFFTIGGSVWVAFKVAKRNVLDQLKISADQKLSENRSIVKAILFLKKPILLGIDEVEHNITENAKYFTIDTFNNIPVFKANIIPFNSIIDFGYMQLYDSFSSSDTFDEEVFLNFWLKVSALPNQLKNLDDYTNYVENKYSTINRDLNDISRKISLHVSEISEKHFPIGKDVTLYDELLESDLDWYYSYKITMLIIKSHSFENVSRLRKLKDLFDGLYEIRNDKKTARIMSLELAQLIVEASAIIKNLEKFFATVSESYGNYSQLFSETNDSIKVFFEKHKI